MTAALRCRLRSRLPRARRRAAAVGLWRPPDAALTGYHLDPHRDPKHTMLTCLLYLARPGDSETYGTKIFRVAGDSDASYKQTHYPEQEGHTCELVKVVPFRPNSMLVFPNSRGAHGATIPAEALPDLERYSYQCYIAPQREGLAALMKARPTDRRAMWRNKSNGSGALHHPFRPRNRYFPWPRRRAYDGACSHTGHSAVLRPSPLASR